jgi:predicted RNase H-like HicB family nuclease
MSQYVELTVNIHFEDGSYWADTPELPGCFASGDTLDELLASMREGVALYRAGDEGGDLLSRRRPLQLKSAVLSDVSS